MLRIRTSILTGCIFVVGVVFLSRVWAGVEVPDFNFEIRPLLSDRCFNCHGPDAEARRAELRLDTRDGALRRLEDGRWIIRPGRPEESEVIRRITAADPAERMPPPDSHLTLDSGEIESIRRWIAAGAEYAPHWSFQMVDSPPLPPTREDPWVRNPIDAFVLQRLQERSLHPQPEAGRATLLRRLTLDLTGLPPTLEELDAFLTDSRPEAYAAQVDRLLALPAYGERQANDWMDLARFADTYGYQADVYRDMSAWRDWVIRAFNENLPYDRFITWQLAGDLLPEATPEQVLATAFNRLHRQTNEGGSIEEEFRIEYVSDRVHTMGTAFLGLTLECARCHDHKFDPITQRDYYALTAFFNSIDESGLYSHFTRATPTPTLLLYPGPETRRRHHTLQREIADAESKLRGRLETFLETGRSDGSTALAAASAEVSMPDTQARFDFETEGSSSDTSAKKSPPPRAEFIDEPQRVPGPHGMAVQFSGDNSVICRGTGHFSRVDPFSLAFWIRREREQERAVVLHHSRAWTDSGSRGYELVLEEGKPFFGLIHFWPGNAVAVRARRALPLGEWEYVVLTYDGSSRAEGLKIYCNGQHMETDVIRDHLYKDILHRSEWGDSDVGNIHLTLGGRFRDSGFQEGAIDELQVFDVALTPLEVHALARRAGVNPAPPTRDAIALHHRRREDAKVRELAEQLHALRVSENNLVNDIPEIMVMRAMTPRRPAFVLKRGAYDARGERVVPDTPNGIFPFPEEYPRNRLGLARWMTDRRNPLTARVAVNRAWKQHFGRGLVATPEDFGSQGKLPTHPHLLDWLAAWFMDHNWNVKSLHRLIVTSATYRQNSEAPAAVRRSDPENRRLSRGPKYRLSAEKIRDQALAVSGLLSPEIGGPSVKPYQPAGLWKESGTGKTYVPDTGDKLYRRSLYTFWRRTAPPPNMLAFDAPSREVCTARRESTSTPLQSLVLMNDTQFFEAARVLAENLVRRHPKDLTARLVEGFRCLTARRPDAREQRILHQAYKEQAAWLHHQPAAAKQLRSTGEYAVQTDLPDAPVAATALVVSILMNYDEFVMQR